MELSNIHLQQKYKLTKLIQTDHQVMIVRRTPSFSASVKLE